MTDATHPGWPELDRLLAARRREFEQQARSWQEAYSDRGGQIFCGRGCANCCTLAVHATLAEARQIAAQLDTRQEQRLHAYIERLRRQLGDLLDLKDYLRRHRQLIGPCPFLADDGACTIYTLRPFACRGLLATRPADWCAVDFATLDPWDRQLFESGLDRTVVAWPSHYVTFTQELAHQCEAAVSAATLAGCGLDLAGNLPLLVWLLRSTALAESLAAGPEACRSVLDASGLDHPLLLTLTTAG